MEVLIGGRKLLATIQLLRFLQSDYLQTYEELFFRLIKD